MERSSQKSPAFLWGCFRSVKQIQRKPKLIHKSSASYAEQLPCPVSTCRNWFRRKRKLKMIANDDDHQYLGATQLRYVDMWGAPCAKWGTIVWSQGNIPPLTSRQHAQIRRSSQILKKSFGCVFATLRNFNEFPGSWQYCMTLGPLPPLANPHRSGVL